MRINQLEIKEKIQNIEVENRKIQKQIDRFQSLYEKSEDTELLKLTLIKENKLNLKMDNNNSILHIPVTFEQELRRT